MVRDLNKDGIMSRSHIENMRKGALQGHMKLLVVLIFVTSLCGQT